MIAIGGATESLYSYPGTMDLVLQRRTGFIRVALQTGASLVPVINFGENELYNTVRGSSRSALRRFQSYALSLLFLLSQPCQACCVATSIYVSVQVPAWLVVSVCLSVMCRCYPVPWSAYSIDSHTK